LSPFQIDKELETRFELEIRTILSSYFIRRDITADLEQATDFAIFRVDPFRVAVRLRRHSYYKKFKHQFTIRWSRPSGVLTEIDKIRNHLVTHFLYGFLDELETKIIDWKLFNLDKFTDPNPLEIHLNNPPDSELAVYSISQFPEDFILASRESLTPEVTAKHTERSF